MLGAYQAGSDRALDEAIAHQTGLERFLRQDPAEHVAFAETTAKLVSLAR